MRKLLWILLATSIASGASPNEPERVVVSRFGKSGLEGWEARHFEGETQFRLVQCAERTVLEAVSEGSATALYRHAQVDLEQTPWLHWSWRVPEPLPPHPERNREGDDFAARLYLGFEGSFGPIGRHTLGYVWATREAVGAHWKTPYMAPARYLVARSGSPYEDWVHESRNVADDYREIYGKAPRNVRAVGLMADSDSYDYDGEPRVVTQFADIYFSSSPQPQPERVEAHC